MMEWNPQKAPDWLSSISYPLVRRLTTWLARCCIVRCLRYFTWKWMKNLFGAGQVAKEGALYLNTRFTSFRRGSPPQKLHLLYARSLGSLKKKTGIKSPERGHHLRGGCHHCWLIADWGGTYLLKLGSKGAAFFFACLLASTSGYVETRTCETRWTCKFLPARESRNQS